MGSAHTADTDQCPVWFFSHVSSTVSENLCVAEAIRSVRNRLCTRLPIIRAEGRRGQAGLVVKIALRIVCPSVTNSHGILHLFAGHTHGFTINFRVCPNELAVLTRDGKPGEMTAPGNKPAIGMLESNTDFISF